MVKTRCAVAHFPLSGTLDHSFCHRFLLHVRPPEHIQEMYVPSDLLCEHNVLFAFALAGAPPVRDTTFNVEERTWGRITLQPPERSFQDRFQNCYAGGRCRCWCCGAVWWLSVLPLLSSSSSSLLRLVLFLVLYVPRNLVRFSEVKRMT